MPKVLVTGANGFIGSNLCAHLIEQGAAVAGLVRPSGDLRFVSDMKRLALVEGDIARPEMLATAMIDADVVYHVAGFSSDWGDWEVFRAANVDGVRNVIEAARAAGVRRVVHISSVSVYGFPGGIDIGEDTPFIRRPGDRYITTKAEGERLAMSYNGRGIGVTAVRPAGVFGPNDRTTTLKLAPVLEAGGFCHVDGGRYVMAPVYIDNLVQMIRLAGESARAPGEAFNAVDDGRTTWRTFIDWMCEALGCAKPRLSAPRHLAWPLAVAVEGAAKALCKKTSPVINKYRVRAVMRDHHYSTEKAKHLLGYRPAVSTRDGVALAADWYRRYAAAGGRG